MHTIELANGITRYLPEDLSQCDAKQYIYMCDLIFNYQNNTITYAEMMTSAVYFLMDMKVDKKNKKSDTDDTISSNVVLIQELLASTFFENIDHQLQVILNFTDNIVPKFKPLLTTFYGPTDGFMNGKCGEYIDALEVFEEFNHSGDTSLLYELAAILYRPKNQFHFFNKNKSDYDGDCRIKYNQNQLSKRIKSLKYAPMGFIYGVYLWFASFQKFLSNAELSKGDKLLKLQILFENTGQTINIDTDDIGMESVLFAMAESGTFGNYKEVQNTNFWTMIMRMYDSRVRDLKQQKYEKDHANSKPS